MLTESMSVAPTPSNMSSAPNVSKMVHNVTLKEVNDELALTLLPVMLIIGVLMIAGFIGNSLVVYIFICRFRKSTQNFLITSLAVFDLVSCLIAMPTEITDQRYVYMFDSLFACKLLTFLTTFCAMCSVFTLLGIAVDRYLKICRPLSNQVEIRHVKKWIIAVILIGMFFSWPALVLFGIRSAETGVPNVIGRDCSTADNVKDTSYPLIYNMVQVAGLVIMTVVLLVLYTFILKAIRRHQRHMRARTSVISLHSTVSTIEVSGSMPSSPRNSVQFTPNGTEGNVKSSIKPRGRRRNKTTVIAFLVTVVFVISFLPHLVLMATRSIVKDFDHNLKGSALVAFNVFVRSYFINSVANPIIYGVLNYKFRKECLWLFKRIFLCQPRPPASSHLPSFSTLS